MSKKLLRADHLREQALAWLPVLLVGLLALGSWWLVRNAPQLPAPNEARALAHEPDYFMRQFSVHSFDAQGHMRSELTGPEALHYPDTETLEVRQPRMRTFDAQGRLTVGSADRGISNADGSQVQLFGNAQVLRHEMRMPDGRALPATEFRGEHLHAFVDEERVTSSQPVNLRRGSDHFTGDRFEYDNKTGVAVLQGQVRGTIMPRP
ncbi:MAG: LPS export ABC transporter periplasmic protein LptC [Burkholderiaceae bacterium]|jgi:lipopolysaccharide export system protein LptC|nr:LPS export ABC transporter periplasmic protein LptC [Burkholderiaceae bacterium]